MKPSCAQPREVELDALRGRRPAPACASTGGRLRGALERGASPSAARRARARRAASIARMHALRASARHRARRCAGALRSGTSDARRGAAPRAARAACSIRLIGRSSGDTADQHREGEDADERGDRVRQAAGEQEALAALRRRTPSLGIIETMPRIGRFETSRSVRASWNVGMIWLAAKLASSPTSERQHAGECRAARGGSARRASGETRGGSMTRNCVPPASCTSLPIVADSRRASRFS